MTRTLGLRVLWTASAAAAVGLLAGAVVDAGASPGATPAEATSTQPSGASPGADDSSAPSGSSAPAPVSDSASGEHVTVAGTERAACPDGTLSSAGTPAPRVVAGRPARPG